MLTASMLVSVLFLRGALAACVFDTPLFITTPQQMEALSGSCLHIPCTFRLEGEFDSSVKISGVWIKSDPRFVIFPNNVVFNSSSQTLNSYRMNITGNLSQKNCTTLFSNVNENYTERYFFRIESKPFKATAYCDPLQVTVKDSPPSPSINITGDLKEKESVTITCSASTPCPLSPPKLTWTLKQDSLNNMEENPDKTFTTKIQEQITLTDKHDGYNITCSATYPVNEGKEVKTAGETQTLRVSYSPRDTSVIVSPTDAVTVGSMVNLTCSCRGNPPVVHFVWFMISNGRLELIKVDTQVYGLNVTDSDQGRLFFCGCRNDLDIQLSTGHQLIFEGDQLNEHVGIQVVLKILGILMLVSTMVIFECWFRSKGSIKPRKDKEEAVYLPGPWGPPQGSTVLSVNMVTANFFLSVLFVSGACATCTITPKPSLGITAPQKVEALSGSCVQIPCIFSTESEFDSSVKISGVWVKRDPRFVIFPNNVVFNGSSQTLNSYRMNITGNLSQKNCTTLFSNVNENYTERYFFRIESKPFKATASCDPLQVTVKDSPPSPRFKISGDLKEKESVTITCSASTPCPLSPPKLTWTLKQDSLNNMEENPDKTFTTKIQEQITLTDKHDGYNITCSATYPVNEGKEVKTAEETQTLRVSYAPKNTSASISPSGLVSAGIHVNLTCSSRANPPVSSFTWFKISRDGHMIVSEGAFYSFNVTEGGVYYCVAMNDLSNQTSPQIHLNIKMGHSSAWWTGVGAMIGITGLISVGVLIWRLKSKRSAFQQTQSLTAAAPATQEAGHEQARASEVEELHYGEIDFSKLRPKVSSNSTQDSGQQQETLYAQVNVSKPVTSFTQAAAGPHDLYAQVKRK
ncbi:uncharacterized protein LOC132994632 [Labrus mixtus]|uniref:uncharacterized protein LOC132994632 n=1 Tax=Labrus mixtus TaxID=508554 RepID=UPI0029C02874|nr:uncharacterized protein LOC132994632 [Labrus mixtus]